MFNQFSNHRPQTSTPPPSNPGQFGQKLQNSVRPSFLGAPATQPPSQPTSFGQASPQNQRAALFDQARTQAAQQQRFTDPRTNLSSMLPGGLTQKQRMDFELLRRTNPGAAQKQLDTYQRFSDIRYNKPATMPDTPIQRSRPTNFRGPRPSF